MTSDTTIKTVFGNASALFADRVVRYVVGFLVGAAIARYLGPTTYGNFSLILTIVTILQPFMGPGLDSMVTRMLVKSTHDAHEVMGSVAALRLWGALTLIVTSTVVALVYRDGDSSFAGLTALMAASALFLPLDVIEIWYQSKMQAKIGVYAKSFAFVASTSAKILTISYKGGLVWFIAAGVLETLTGAIGLLFFYRKDNQHIRLWRKSMSTLLTLLRSGWALVASAIVLLALQRIDQLCIGKMLGDTSVGIYASAFRFTEFAYSIPTLLSITFLPRLLEKHANDQEQYEIELVHFYRILVLVAVTVSIGTTIVANPLIPIVFGAAFSQATTLLQVQIWSCLFLFLTIGSNQHFIVEGNTSVILLRILIGCVTSLVLNVFFIPKYGMMGAAVANLFSNLVSLIAIVLFPSARAHVGLVLKSLEPRSVGALVLSLSRQLRIVLRK